MASKLIQKSFRFPDKVVEVLERRAQNTLGINFNQYVQYLVLNEAKTSQENDIPDLTHLYSKKELKEIEDAVREAREEIASGKKLPQLKSPEDIDKFMQDILDDKI